MKILKKISYIFFLIIILTIPTKSNASVNNLTIDKKIGMNGFVDCKLENFTAGGTLREYHNFGWTYDANSGKCYFKSSWFDFDDFYKRVHDLGVEILPCIQQGNNTHNREYKPVADGASTLDPASYKIHANVLFNYAARYGYTQVEESRLNLTSSTEAKTGLGYITYYENWNEPDKTWIGQDACFSPEEFAAMCSADYDGHEGTLGDTYGIKQADPNAKLVYGGLAGGSAGVEYLNRMKQWSEVNRTSKTLPFDVINFHAYCGTRSPENSSLVESATKLIEWRDNNAPDKEIWLTEFGWDTNTASPRSAPSFDTQRDWIVREFLIIDRLGLDRATVYNGRDDGDATNTTQYATCGLTTKKGEEAKKSSWYGVKTLKTVLTDFKFDSVIEEKNNLYIYKYKNSKTNEECFVLWSPTEDGSKIDNYTLNIGNRTNAELTSLKDKEENGIKTNLTINENTVKVTVTESPIFVKVSGEKETEEKNEEPKNETEENKQQESENKEENKQEENIKKENENNKENQSQENNKEDKSNIKEENNSKETENKYNNVTKEKEMKIITIQDSNKSNTNNTNNDTITVVQNNNSQTKRILPQTGTNDNILIAISVFIILSIIFGIKYRKIKQ